MAPEQILKWGHTSGAGNPFVVPLHFFGSASTILVSVFVVVSTDSSVSCLLSFYSRCPSAQPFAKVEARAPRSLWSRHHWKSPSFAVSVFKWRSTGEYNHSAFFRQKRQHNTQCSIKNERKQTRTIATYNDHCILLLFSAKMSIIWPAQRCRFIFFVNISHLQCKFH